MAPVRYFALLSACLLAGCTAQPEGPSSWQDRGPAPGSSAPAVGAQQSGPTLGTPFYAWADVLDENGPASIEFSLPRENGEASRDLASIDSAALVLHSDGFVVALESMHVHLPAVPGCLSDAGLELETIASGKVLAADPNALHAEFDVRFVLVGKRLDDGTQVRVMPEKSARLSMRVTRTGEAVQVSIGSEHDTGEWLVGEDRVKGGPIGLKLSGVLVSP